MVNGSQGQVLLGLIRVGVATQAHSTGIYRVVSHPHVVQLQKKPIC